MELNSQNLSAMRTAFILKFKNAFGAVPTTYQKFCMVEGSKDTTMLEFPFLETFAFMRKWVGDRQVKNLNSKVLQLVEEAFEDTIGVPVRSIEADKWQLYGAIFAQMGEAGAQLWDRLAVEAITAPKPWLDNKAFFGTHKYGNSTIINSTSSDLSVTTFESAFTAMCSYAGHNGEKLGVRPDTLMVGPALYNSAWEIIENTHTVSGNATLPNRNYKKVELLENSRLDGDSWFLMQAKGQIKPVILQKSKECELVALDKSTDENVFSRAEIIYGTSAYGSAACAFPHLIYRGGQ